jgi:hypothetical protein
MMVGSIGVKLITDLYIVLYEQSMLHAWEGRGMFAEFWLESLREGNHFEDWA